MNNAEQIGAMLESMGFVPYHKVGCSFVRGYASDSASQKWIPQRWHKKKSTVIEVTVIQKNAVRWLVIAEDYGHTRQIYEGKATPSLIREVLEANGLVETIKDEVGAYSIEKNDPGLVVLRNKRGDSFSFNPDEHPGAYDFFVYGLEASKFTQTVENQQTRLAELREAIDILTERKQTSQDPVFNEAIKTVVSAAKEHLAEQYRIIYEPNAGEKISGALHEKIATLLETSKAEIGWDWIEEKDELQIHFYTAVPSNVTTVIIPNGSPITPETLREKANEK